MCDAESRFVLTVSISRIAADPDEWQRDTNFTLKWMDKQTESPLRGGRRLFALLRFLICFFDAYDESSESEEVRMYTNDKELADEILERIRKTCDESKDGNLRIAQKTVLADMIGQFGIPNKEGSAPQSVIKWLRKNDVALYLAIEDTCD